MIVNGVPAVSVARTCPSSRHSVRFMHGSLRNADARCSPPESTRKSAGDRVPARQLGKRRADSPYRTEADAPDQRATRQGTFRKPRKRARPPRTGSPSSAIARESARGSARSRSRPSSRASAMPAHWWMPEPNARWRFGVRADVESLRVRELCRVAVRGADRDRDPRSAPAARRRRLRPSAVVMRLPSWFELS